MGTTESQIYKSDYELFKERNTDLTVIEVGDEYNLKFVPIEKIYSVRLPSEDREDNFYSIYIELHDGKCDAFICDTFEEAKELYNDIKRKIEYYYLLK